MTAIAIIPAKGTSRRIPRKNLKLFYGKPIIAYSIETAQKSGLFDHIYASTEDEEIAIVAHQYGAEVIARPPELAEIGVPDCGTQEVTRHALQTLRIKNGFACCIYPCTPLMTAEDLKYGFAMLAKGWAFNYVFIKGWYYWGHVEDFWNNPDGLNDGLSITVGTRRYIDINTPEEWDKAEQMYAKLQVLQCA